jgi:hypothetical protein
MIEIIGSDDDADLASRVPLAVWLEQGRQPITFAS